MVALDAGDWTALEIVKLTVQALTPIAVFVFGLLATHQIRVLDEKRWARQRVIEERIKFYGDVASILNDTYCYFVFVGGWKQLSPDDVLDRKRRCDQKFRIHQAYFADDVLTAYRNFRTGCFAEFSGSNRDALIKARIDSPRGDRRAAWLAAKGQPWPADWDGRFVPASEATSPDEVTTRYDKLIAALRGTLVIGDETSAAPPGPAR